MARVLSPCADSSATSSWLSALLLGYVLPMTDKPQVMAIAHVPTGETLEVAIEGPPFAPSLPGSAFVLPMQELRFTVYLRPGQDESSLEQHYDSDTGHRPHS